MIPKKIHYCWLSNDAMPEKLQRCIDSWKMKLPDYEIIKWDLKKFPLEKSIWVRQAYERKKYAFAADYIRLYALVTEGLLIIKQYFIKLALRHKSGSISVIRQCVENPLD